MTSQVSKKQRVLQGVLVLTLATPLVMHPSLFYFPFTTTKVWFFRTIILLSLLAYVFFADKISILKPKHNMVAYAVLFFLAIYALTTINSIDVTRSFWGNYERMLGLLTMIYFVVYFILMRSIFTDAVSWRWFWRIFGGVGVVAFFLGLYQNSNPDFLLGRAFDGSYGPRENITFGNPIYVGQFSIYLIFLGLYWLKDAFDRCRGKFFENKEAWFWIVVVFSGFGLLFLSQTRSSLIGMVVALFCGCALVAVLHNKKRVRKGFLALFVLLGMGAALVLSPWSKQILGSVAGGSRYADLSILSATNVNRIFGWKAALRAWQDHPVVGWGPHTFAFVFNKYFDSRQLGSRDFTDTWFDSSHNQYLDTLAEQGVLGLIALLLLYGSVLLGLLLAYRSGKIQLWHMVLLFGLMLTHIVANVFVFDQISSYFSLFSLLAFVSFIIDGQQKDQDRMVLPKKFQRSLIISTSIVVIIAGYYTVVVPVSASTSMLASIHGAVRTGSIPELLESSKEAARKSVAHDDHLYSKLAELLLDTEYIPEDQLHHMILLYRFTLSGLQQQMEKHPHDVALPMLAAPLFHNAYKTERSNFSNGREIGDQFFAKAASLSPDRQQILAYWGNQVMRSGNRKDARHLFVQALSLSPSSPIMFGLYADYVMLEEGNPSKAFHLYRWGIDNRLVDITSKRLVGMTAAYADLHGPKEALEQLDYMIECFTENAGTEQCDVYNGIDPIPSFLKPLYDFREHLADAA